MNYKQLLKEFTIFIETIPETIDFYDIWEIKAIFEKLQNNFNNLNFQQKQEYIKLVRNLKSRLNNVKITQNDPLVEKEVFILKNMIKKNGNNKL